MSGETGRRSSSQVAHEAEDTRAHLANTLEQLRDNLRPENVMDEVVQNAKAGVTSIADTIVGLTKAYPLPSILAATGAALVSGLTRRRPGRISPSGDTKHNGSVPFEPAPGRATVPRTEPTRRLAGTTISEGAEHLQSRANDFYDAASAKANNALEVASGYMPQGAKAARSRFSTLLDEQPLILGAIGLAIGAAIGAAIPISRTEDDLMGETAHSVRNAAGQAARQEVEELRGVASATLDNVKKVAADHGFSSDNVNGLVRDVGAQARSAVDQVGGSFDHGSKDV